MWTPDQTACNSSLIWIDTVCQRGFKIFSADDKSKRLVVIGALRVNKCEFSVQGGKKLPFLHRLINKTRITAPNTAIHMQLIGNNMRDVSRLRALQLSSRQCCIARSGLF